MFNNDKHFTLNILDANMKKKLNITRLIYSTVPILLLIISLTSAIILNTSYVTEAEDSIEDINFDFPLNNTFDLGTPFLVDSSTTT